MTQVDHKVLKGKENILSTLREVTIIIQEATIRLITDFFRDEKERQEQQQKRKTREKKRMKKSLLKV